MRKLGPVPHCDTCTCTPTTADLFRSAIQQALDEDGLTQVALAEKVGISPKHLNQILRGHMDARPEIADRILAALGRRLVVALEAAA